MARARSMSLLFWLLLAFAAFASVASACPGANGHNHAEVAIARRQAAADAPAGAGLGCPVCGRSVDCTTAVEIKKGTQKICACSPQHADLIYNEPLTYAESTVPSESTDMTPVGDGMQCPFCSMDAVVGHSLSLKGNQTVYACMMTAHNTLLFKSGALKESFSGTIVGQNDLATESTSTAVAGSTADSVSSTPNTAAAAAPVSVSALCVAALSAALVVCA